ncbi:hypothetical protein BDR03DRAFT_985605 [Suillus americanus]|nr:hypothetical protein BDR03DRAFT_985605 [Suillus americanus]
MEKETKKVDLIITKWASAIMPILQYHSTAVMNYMTACTFLGESMHDATNIRTVEVLMKYVGHGFSITAEPFKLGIHNCLRSTYCPSTTRNTLDDETLQWGFKEIETVGNTTIACGDMALIIWHLGGNDCMEDGDNDSTTYIGVGDWE